MCIVNSTPKQRELRILHVAVNVDRRRGGTAQAPMSLCRGLRRYGVEAEVVSVVVRGNEECSLTREYPDVPSLELPSSFPNRFTNSNALGEWLDDYVCEYDLVEIHEIFSCPPIFASRACVRNGVPYILNTHGGLIPSDLKKRRMLKFLFRKTFLQPLLRNAQVLKAATKFESDTMVTYGAQTAKAVVPLPVEPLITGGDGGRFRKSFGIPNDAVVVGCMARIDPVKGIDLLISALARLKQRFPKLWFLLIGSGNAEYVAKVTGMIRDQGLESWTTMPGFLSGVDKSDALASTQIYAQLSWRENFSYTVAEAMAAGLPSVLSDQIGLASQVTEVGAGYTCEPSVDNAERALSELLGQPQLWREMGERARMKFEKSLSQSATIESLIQLYSQVLGRHRGFGSHSIGRAG